MLTAASLPSAQRAGKHLVRTHPEKHHAGYLKPCGKDPAGRPLRRAGRRKSCRGPVMAPTAIDFCSASTPRHLNSGCTLSKFHASFIHKRADSSAEKGYNGLRASLWPLE